MHWEKFGKNKFPRCSLPVVCTDEFLTESSFFKEVATYFLVQTDALPVIYTDFCQSSIQAPFQSYTQTLCQSSIGTTPLQSSIQIIYQSSKADSLPFLDKDSLPLVQETAYWSFIGTYCQSHKDIVPKLDKISWEVSHEYFLLYRLPIIISRL